MITTVAKQDDLPVFQFHFAQIVHFNYLQKQHWLNEDIFVM